MHPSRERATRPDRGRSERGLTIVEVVVAAFVLMVVASAIAMASVGGTKQRGAGRLQIALTTAGQQVQDDVISDRAWMEDVPACKRLNNPCDIRSYVTPEARDLQDAGGRAELVTATAEALDSDVDETGDQDEDGVIPDYYRLVIELRLPTEVAQRYNVPVATSLRRFVTTIDRRGAEQVGSIAVEVCRVENQADERLQLQGCATNGNTHVAMTNCEPTDGRCDASRPEVFGDCAPGATQDCRDAFRWINHNGASNASPMGPAPFVSLTRLRPGAVSFTLVDVSSGRRIPSGQAKVDDGVFVFQNVPAGEFRIDGLPGRMGLYERWKSKEIPAYHGAPGDAASGATIAVDPGVRTKALALYRPSTTSDGIDLSFQRRVRTYFLRGPFTTEETSVPEMAPTDGYQGASADSYCSLMQGADTDTSQFTTYDCVDLRPFGKNCVDLFVEGEFFKDVGEGNGDTKFLYPDVITGLPGSGNYLRKQTNGPTLAMRFCTFYAEYMTHTYWGRVASPTWETRDGAAKANTYAVEAAPEVRHVEYDRNGPWIQIPQCRVEWKTQCLPSGQRFAPPLGDGLKPGLNTRMQVADAGNHARNSTYSGTPSWLTNPMWVYPNGRFRSADGSTQPAGVNFNFVGLGECYWRSSRYAGEQLGDCNPCSPVWQPGWEIPGACAILTKTEWRRPAWETSYHYDWQGDGVGTDSLTKPIEGKEGVINYDPPWQCSGTTPRVVRGANCRATPRGGGSKFIPDTKHRSSANGGTGLVNRVPFGSGGGL